MKKILIAGVILFCYQNVFCQNLLRPESMEYDVKNNRILISNKGDIINNNKGFIMQMAPNGSNIQPFANSGTGPFNALEIINDIVYAACEDGHVYGYNLSTGAEVINWELTNAQTPNGLSHDGNILYVSDAAQSNVYRIDVTTGKDSLWVIGGTAIKINGIYMDKANNRLFLCGWESKSQYYDVYAVNLTTGVVTEYYDGPNAKVDGMARDKCGNYYLSFWSENKVFKYNSNNFDNPILILDATNGLNGPADIGIDTVNNNLLIPNLNSSTVKIHSLEAYCPTLSIIEETDKIDGLFYPSPSNGVLFWDKNQIFDCIEVYSPAGQLLLKKENISGQNSLDISGLESNLLIVRAISSKQAVFEQKILVRNI